MMTIATQQTLEDALKAKEISLCLAGGEYVLDVSRVASDTLTVEGEDGGAPVRLRLLREECQIGKTVVFRQVQFIGLTDSQWDGAVYELCTFEVPERENLRFCYAQHDYTDPECAFFAARGKVSLRGCMISSQYGDGLHVSIDATVSLHDCTVSCRRTGLTLLRGDDAELDGVCFQRAAIGISLWRLSQAAWRGLTFKRNVFRALFIEDPTDSAAAGELTLTDCTFVGDGVRNITLEKLALSDAFGDTCGPLNCLFERCSFADLLLMENKRIHPTLFRGCTFENVVLLNSCDEDDIAYETDFDHCDFRTCEEPSPSSPCQRRYRACTFTDMTLKLYAADRIVKCKFENACVAVVEPAENGQCLKLEKGTAAIMGCSFLGIRCKPEKERSSRWGVDFSAHEWIGTPLQNFLGKTEGSIYKVPLEVNLRSQEQSTALLVDAPCMVADVTICGFGVGIKSRRAELRTQYSSLYERVDIVDCDVGVEQLCSRNSIMISDLNIHGCRIGIHVRKRRHLSLRDVAFRENAIGLLLDGTVWIDCIESCEFSRNAIAIVGESMNGFKLLHSRFMAQYLCAILVQRLGLGDPSDSSFDSVCVIADNRFSQNGCADILIASWSTWLSKGDLQAQVTNNRHIESDTAMMFMNDNVDNVTSAFTVDMGWATLSEAERTIGVNRLIDSFRFV